jgi:hypothetical protein
VRLDHLLSKESTARVRSPFAPKLGELLRRAPANRFVDKPRPRVASGRTWHHRGRRRRASLFRFEGARALGPSGRSVRVPWAARHPSLRESSRSPSPEVCARRSSAARVLTRWLRTAERARASRTKKLPSYKEPTVDALAPDADEGRGWLRKATGSCRPSAMTRGYPNGETRLGSCPVTPA